MEIHGYRLFCRRLHTETQVSGENSSIFILNLRNLVLQTLPHLPGIQAIQSDRDTFKAD